jgi:hypothetical protein
MRFIVADRPTGATKDTRCRKVFGHSLIKISGQTSRSALGHGDFVGRAVIVYD